MENNLKENYIILEITIEESNGNNLTNLLGIKQDSNNNEDPYLYPFINEANSILYINNNKIEDFSLIQEFPNVGTFNIKIELSELLSDLSYIFSLC